MSDLLAAARENDKHESAGVWLFELGRRYPSTPKLTSGMGLAQERPTLGVVMTGPAATGWARAERDVDFYDLTLLSRMMLDVLHVLHVSTLWEVYRVGVEQFKPIKRAYLMELDLLRAHGTLPADLAVPGNHALPRRPA
jgi:hypothetical protein